MLAEPQVPGDQSGTLDTGRGTSATQAEAEKNIYVNFTKEKLKYVYLIGILGDNFGNGSSRLST